MDTPATSRKRPASSPLNVKAFEPTCSVRSISPPRARRCLALGPHPPPTMRSYFTGTVRGGGVDTTMLPPKEAQCFQPPLHPKCSWHYYNQQQWELHIISDDQRLEGRHRNCSKGKATPVCSPAQSGHYMKCLQFGCGLTQKTALFFNCIPVNYVAIIRKR